LKLPHVSGFEAVPEIRKYRPNIPIIAQTAYAMINDKEKAMEIGCDDYIAKPINIEMFFIKVNRYLSLRS
jgi:CheY-like chemotaxis protein